MGGIRSILSIVLRKGYALFLHDEDRLGQYPHWRRSLNVLATGSILLILILGSTSFVFGWELALATTLLVLGILGNVWRKRFISPSSIWLQSILLRTVFWGERVRNRDNGDVFRRYIEKFHLSFAVVGLAAALLTIPMSLELYQQLSIEFGLGANIARTLWIVHATATGFSFVVLVFFWEYLGDEYDSNAHIRIAVRYTWALHIVYFLLAANISIGLAALTAQMAPTTPMVLIQAVFYLLSIVGIYWIYRIVYEFMTQEILSGKMFNELSHSLRENLLESEKAVWLRVLEHQIGEEFPRYPLPQFNGSQERFQAQDIEIQGRITDIHLERIHDLFDEAESYGVSIEKLPEYGESYVASDEVLVVNGSPNQRQLKSLKEGLNQAVKVI